MLPQLQQKLNELTAQKAVFLQIINNATPAQRLQKPNEQAWNMLQVGHHVLLAEGGATKFMLTRQPIKISLGQQIKSRLNSIMLNIFLKSPLKFKAPKVVSTIVAEQQLPLEQLTTQWAEASEQLTQYLANFNTAHLKHSVFKHPLVGPLTITQTLDFMIEHIQHHIPQLQRLSK